MPQEHPGSERARIARAAGAKEESLWSDWVAHVCDREHMPRPSLREWDVLRSLWFPGKAPLESIEELRREREQEPHGPLRLAFEDHAQLMGWDTTRSKQDRQQYAFGGVEMAWCTWLECERRHRLKEAGEEDV